MSTSTISNGEEKMFQQKKRRGRRPRKVTDPYPLSPVVYNSESNNIQFFTNEHRSPVETIVKANSEEINPLNPAQNFFGDDVLVIYAAAAATVDRENSSTGQRSKLRLLQAEAIGIRKPELVSCSNPNQLELLYAITTPNQEVNGRRVQVERPLVISASELGKIGEVVVQSIHASSKISLPLLPVEVSYHGSTAVAQSVLCNNDEQLTNLIHRVRELRAKSRPSPNIQQKPTTSTPNPNPNLQPQGKLEHCVMSVINHNFKSKVALKTSPPVIDITGDENPVPIRRRRGRKPKQKINDDEITPVPEPQTPKAKRKYTKSGNNSKTSKIIQQHVAEFLEKEDSPPKSEQNLKSMVSPYTRGQEQWKTPFQVQVEVENDLDVNNNLIRQQAINRNRPYSGNYRITKGLADLAQAVSDISYTMNSQHLDQQAVRSIELEIEPDSSTTDLGPQPHGTIRPTGDGKEQLPPFQETVDGRRRQCAVRRLTFNSYPY